jgi:phospholipid/cholesterol/gamma-HCH transport system permease protein
MAPGSAWIKTADARDGALRLLAGGRWDLVGTARLTAGLDAVAPAAGRPVLLEMDGLEALDTVGAILLAHLLDRLEAGDRRVEMTAARPEHAALLDAVRQAERGEPLPTRRDTLIIDMIERTGRGAVEALKEARDLLGFLGLLTITVGRIIRRPSRLRLAAVMFHIEQTGLNALPILGLLTFLIGVVLSFQGADQLRRFGADVFVVNLLGISILREIGVLMTAIIVAGRSGSAFTAQIGTMKVNQEVDALRTLGLDPLELLVVPRVLALMITLPLLAFFADVMGLFGGAMMTYTTLGITFAQFIKQLNSAIGLSTFVVGIVKAPVFALVIAMVGCYEGLKVSGSAESVGRLTTRSVVEGIFLVIVMDAAFSILFSLLGV